ncbi:hypothetical protein BPOR_0056g00170 [Botrytis porri]|uniref:Uncharacterized protein n=1 Tax=Botrytis porri TaxID=87229 RepID=A0A4Z1L1H4_9HELO|nr:hypothetical protein BPOR_0056g00170 [Botrytis porri]
MRAKNHDLKLEEAYGLSEFTPQSKSHNKVLPDQYFGVTTIWSLRQQAIVAKITGYVSFFNYDTGKPANFIEVGGVYKDLYDVLMARMERQNEIAEW